MHRDRRRTADARRIFTDTLNIPPAGRMEFIVPGLPAGQTGTFVTNGLRHRTGRRSSTEPQLLAKLTTGGSSNAASSRKHTGEAAHAAGTLLRTWRGLTPTTTRSLYFSEQNIGTNGGTQFYITVSGQTAEAVPHG